MRHTLPAGEARLGVRSQQLPPLLPPSLAPSSYEPKVKGGICCDRTPRRFARKHFLPVGNWEERSDIIPLSQASPEALFPAVAIEMIAYSLERWVRVEPRTTDRRRGEVLGAGYWGLGKAS